MDVEDNMPVNSQRQETPKRSFGALNFILLTTTVGGFVLSGILYYQSIDIRTQYKDMSSIIKNLETELDAERRSVSDCREELNVVESHLKVYMGNTETPDQVVPNQDSYEVRQQEEQQRIQEEQRQHEELKRQEEQQRQQQEQQRQQEELQKQLEQQRQQEEHQRQLEQQRQQEEQQRQLEQQRQQEEQQRQVEQQRQQEEQQRQLEQQRQQEQQQRQQEELQRQQQQN